MHISSKISNGVNSRSASIFCALFLCAIVAVWFIAPSVVSADHSFTHTVQELRMRFNALVESFLGTRWNGAPDAFSAAALLAVADDTRIQKLETELQSYQSRIEQLKSKSQTEGEKRELKSLEDEVSFVQSKLDELRGGGLRLTKTLRYGSAGTDVRRLQEFFAKDKEVYSEGLATGYFGKLTEDAVKRFQEKNGIEPVGIVGPKTRVVINDVSHGVVAKEIAAEVKAPSSARPAELPKPLKDVEVAKAAKKGDSGEHIKKTQEFLSMFPDIYPNGSATGYYGEQTEKAVKKFQEKIGHVPTGEVDEKTKEILNLLLVAGEKKKSPKITDVTPSSGSEGIMVTLTGKGFTDEKNSIMVRGKIVASGLKSYDNNTQLDFVVTSDIPCVAGSKKACPVKVVNANGISNAKPFKLLKVLLVPPGVATTTPPEVIPPPPPPPPSPTPPPPSLTPTDTTPPFRSNGLPSGELSYGTGSAAVSLVTDENATCRYAASAGAAYSSMTLQFSTTGGTSHSLSALGLEDGNSYNYYVRCQDSAGNANSDDFIILFSVARPPKPVISGFAPAKGAAGTAVTVTGSGFTAAGNSVNFAGLVAASGIASTDGKNLAFRIPAGTSCNVGETCAVSVTNVNGTSNEAGFLMTQAVSPVKVVFPNGGENLVQGVDFTFSWLGGTDRVDLVLVEEAATNGVDPSPYLVGWIATSSALKPGSAFNWNLKTVCSADGTVCTDITPGKYKIMALSEDELGNLTVWDDVTDLSGNWDVSDNAFTISPAATLTVVVPNGGEIGSQNSAFIICWAAIDLKSKTVKIELLKNGAPYRTIYSSYPQSAVTGAFITNWTIPGDIPEGADYQVKVSDVSLSVQNDTSDKPFSIVAATSAIKVYEPYSSTIWYSGFDGPVNWYASNIQSKAVTINLWKGGFFYRNLAANMPQNYWDGGGSYSTGWFWKKVKIPTDLPNGQDYAVEIVDANDSSVRGFSEKFAVVQYPSSMTVKGRMFDYFTAAPLTNSYVNYWDGSYWWNSKPTNTNGEFSMVATTTDLLLSRGQSFWTYPVAHNYGYFVVRSNAYGLYAYVSIFPFIGKSYTFPVTAGEVNFGDIPFWPFVDSGYVVSEIPTKFNINYRSSETGLSTTNTWTGSNYNYSQGLWKAVPQALDVWARIEDKPGTVYYSPMLNLPATPRVPSQTLSLFNRTPQWEPYSIAAYASYWPQLLKVGTALSGRAYAYGGVAPYTWSVLAGQLPPGVTLSSDGTISGTPTETGVYDAVLLVQDANKMHGVVPLLRFDVCTVCGVSVPTIKVIDPQARVEMYPGSTYTISWDSFGITGRSLVFDLYKGGSFLRKIGGYTQSAEAGRYYYNWQVPQDLAAGNDYYIRISDMNNSATYGESDTFLIQGKQNASWSESGNATYSPSLSFQQATSTNQFRLYEQRPGQASLALVSTFTAPQCYQWTPSGKWQLYISCYSWYPNPQWSLRYQTYASASEFPAGEYAYEFREVDGAGNEIVAAHWKLRALEAVSVTYPASADSPLSSSSLTPAIRWNVPKDWPAMFEKSYRVNVYEAYTGKFVHSMWGLSAPGDTAGFRMYDGSALDPTKKYTISVSYRKSLIDSATAQYTEYIAMSSGASLFWFDQYVTPPPLSVTTESFPPAMLSTSYNAALSAAGGMAPYKWFLVSGTLPQGFSMDASGRIYGWPNQQGIFKFTVQVTDLLGGIATKDLSIEVMPEVGAFWSGGDGTNPLYTQYVKFGYAKPADVTTLKLYQKKPGEISFTAAGTFSGITGTCNAGYSPADSLWRLSFYCGTSYQYWQASLKSSYAASYFPVGEYDYYVAAIGSDGSETNITPTIKQFALDRIAIVSPTEAQSPLATSTPTFQWTVAQTGWPSGMSYPSYRIMVYPQGSYNYVYYKWAYGKVGVPTAYAVYDNATPLDLTKKYIVNVQNYSYGQTALDSATFTKISYISMSAGVSTFWFGQYAPPPPVSISTESLPAAMIWTSYNAALTVTGGLAPYTWSLVSGVLPQGVSMDTSGRIYGWPSQQGIFKFTVQVTDLLGGIATKDLSIEVKTDTGAYWGGGYGINPLYTQYVKFGYTKPADVATLKLYQKKPGETSFAAVGTFSGITETCSTTYSPADSLWRLYFTCGTSYRYWQANLKTSYAASYFPVGEYDYYVAAIGSDGLETNITPTIKQFALDRTTIISPTEAQSPTSSKPTFEWTVAQTGWPSGVSQPYYSITVYPEGTYSYAYYKGAYGKVGVATASFVYDSITALDPAKKYMVNILNYNQAVLDSASFTKISYVSMLDAVTKFWISP